MKLLSDVAMPIFSYQAPVPSFVGKRLAIRRKYCPFLNSLALTVMLSPGQTSAGVSRKQESRGVGVGVAVGVDVGGVGVGAGVDAGGGSAVCPDGELGAGSGAGGGGAGYGTHPPKKAITRRIDAKV